MEQHITNYLTCNLVRVLAMIDYELMGLAQRYTLYPRKRLQFYLCQYYNLALIYEYNYELHQVLFEHAQMYLLI